MLLTTFILVSVQAFAFEQVPFWMSTESITMDVCCFDANNDTYNDLLFAVYGSDSDGELQLYLNNNGSFSQTPNWTSPCAAYQSICSGDVDNDGDVDIAAGVVRASTDYAYNEVYLNDGNGQFGSYPVWISSDDLDTIHIQMADIDSDGWLELISANYGSKILVYDNQFSSGGTFSTPLKWFGNSSNSSFSVGSSSGINGSISSTPSLICANLHPMGDFMVMKHSIYSFDFSSLPPVYLEWCSSAQKPDYGYWFSLFDLDADGDIDWLASGNGESIIIGTHTYQYDEYTVTEIHDNSTSYAFDFNSILKAIPIILSDPLDAYNPYIFLCNRGLRVFDEDGCGHIMNQSEDILLSIQSVSNGYELNVEWVSEAASPTTDASFSDIDRGSLYTQLHNYYVTYPNEMISVNPFYERVVSISLPSGETIPFHSDRDNGTISLIGNYTGTFVDIVIERSNELDLIRSSSNYNSINIFMEGI